MHPVSLSPVQLTQLVPETVVGSFHHVDVDLLRSVLRHGLRDGGCVDAYCAVSSTVFTLGLNQLVSFFDCFIVTRLTHVVGRLLL